MTSKENDKAENKVQLEAEKCQVNLKCIVAPEIEILEAFSGMHVETRKRICICSVLIMLATKMPAFPVDVCMILKNEQQEKKIWEV